MTDRFLLVFLGVAVVALTPAVAGATGGGRPCTVEGALRFKEALMCGQALESVEARLNRYQATGDRDAVIGPGVLAEAGHLWRAALSDAGTSVDVLYALARLHWYRYRAYDGDDQINDFQTSLLLFARVAQVDKELVPHEVLPILERAA